MLQVTTRPQVWWLLDFDPRAIGEYLGEQWRSTFITLVLVWVSSASSKAWPPATTATSLSQVNCSLLPNDWTVERKGFLISSYAWLAAEMGSLRAGGWKARPIIWLTSPLPAGCHYPQQVRAWPKEGGYLYLKLWTRGMKRLQVCSDMLDLFSWQIWLIL